MDLGPHLCSPGGRLFGGAALAAILEAAEQTAGRPAVWASAQYLHSPRTPSALSLVVEVHHEGNRVSHARVTVYDDDVLTAQAIVTLADPRPDRADHQWATAPSVPAPEDSPHRYFIDEGLGSINTEMEVRVAVGRTSQELAGPSDDGRCVLWARPRRPLPVGPSLLAVLADHVPFGVTQALGALEPAASLENTLWVSEGAPGAEPGWLLLDVAVSAIDGGVGSGRVDVYDGAGRLLATGTQTFVV